MISLFRIVWPASPSSSSARPLWTYQLSSFSRWNWRLSDSPAFTNRTLPTYCSATAQISSHPHGLSTRRASNDQRSRPSKFGDSMLTVFASLLDSTVRTPFGVLLHELLGAAEVLGRVHGQPHTAMPVAAELALLGELGERVLLVVAALGQAPQRLVVEHVHPGVDPVVEQRRLAQ